MEATSKKGIAGSTLKLIAIITMLIDHTGATLIERTMYTRGYLEAANDSDVLINWFTSTPSNIVLFLLDMIMRFTGRIAFPIFIFLLVEGFTHTHNRAKYLLRMVIFTIIAEIPFNLAIDCNLSSPFYQSVFFTLTIGLLVMWGMETLKNKTYEGVIFIILKYVSFFLFGFVGFYIFAQTIFGGFVLPLLPDLNWNVPVTILGLSLYLPGPGFLIVGSITGVISVIVFFIVTANKDNNAVISEALSWFPVYGGLILADFLFTDYAASGILAIVLMYIFREKKAKAMLISVLALSIINPLEIIALVDTAFVSMYNGERGLKLKYVFYAFYPAHLLILYLIGHFIMHVM